MVQNRFFLSFPVKKVNNNKFSSQNFVISSKITFQNNVQDDMNKFFEFRSKKTLLWPHCDNSSARCGAPTTSSLRHWRKDWENSSRLWQPIIEAFDLTRFYFIKYSFKTMTKLGDISILNKTIKSKQKAKN